MNQNMPRQITQEEIDKQLSKEEVQKTQVLNLQEVQKVVRYEKIASKKPAIIVAILGVISIFFGTTLSVIQFLQQEEPVPQIETRKNENKVINPVTNNSKLYCYHNTSANPDGTDSEFSIDLTFTNNVLTNFEKRFYVKQTPGNTQGLTTIDNYIKAYNSFMNQTDGYNIQVTSNPTELTVLVNVDYTHLDLNLLNPIQATHFSTSVEFQPNTTKEEVLNTYTSSGYICQ
ncbi:MAG: hypothetical protein IJ842_02975 [Bacilli bacterium]|nr:hypothetical protein [Bacilli bacterium]